MKKTNKQFKKIFWMLKLRELIYTVLVIAGLILHHYTAEWVFTEKYHADTVPVIIEGYHESRQAKHNCVLSYPTPCPNYGADGLHHYPDGTKNYTFEPIYTSKFRLLDVTKKDSAAQYYFFIYLLSIVSITIIILIIGTIDAIVEVNQELAKKHIKEKKDITLFKKYILYRVKK